MKLAILALAVGLAAPAFAAAPLSVDFEKAWEYGQDVGEAYAAEGVSFVNVLAFSNSVDESFYRNAPSMLGVAMAQLDGVSNTAAFMNVAGGVSGGLSFYYSSPEAVTGAIKAYSGLNGSGALLGTIDLSANSADYSRWTQAVLSFGGTAQSFELTNAANLVALDNIAAVPEPTSMALLLAGGALLAARRRRG